ncbi:MAG: hypothetical protein IJ435_05950 [Clostridia bacterium]|nr:hypothetical protein [Clostridia bacterium]
MKNLFILIFCVVLMFSLCGCNDGATPESETAMQSAEEQSTGIVPNDVPEDSEAAINVKAVVADYLDTFISCDYEKIKENLHEDDRWCFNFESEDQMDFYNAIFPLVEYKFDYVSEYEGVYGVMTEITSPDMAQVYGTIITDYIDSTTGNSNQSPKEIMSGSKDRMIELIKSSETPRRVGQLYIYVEYIDGEYIPRCNAFLANELTGGAPETSDEISSSLNEAVGALSE